LDLAAGPEAHATADGTASFDNDLVAILAAQ
jgi:hypothetical protein